MAAGRKATGANVFAEGKEIVHIPLDHVESPHAYALMIPQSETERVLEEHLNGYGVQVERSVELVEFGDAVTSTLRLADGREETVDSSWLLGCDGAHSAVRHGLGMQFEGDTLQTEWILADVQLTGSPKPGEVGGDLAHEWRAGDLPDYGNPVSRDCGHGRNSGRKEAFGPDVGGGAGGAGSARGGDAGDRSDLAFAVPHQ